MASSRPSRSESPEQPDPSVISRAILRDSPSRCANSCRAAVSSAHPFAMALKICKCYCQQPSPSNLGTTVFVNRPPILMVLGSRLLAHVGRPLFLPDDGVDHPRRTPTPSRLPPGDSRSPISSTSLFKLFFTSCFSSYPIPPPVLSVFNNPGHGHQL